MKWNIQEDYLVLKSLSWELDLGKRQKLLHSIFFSHQGEELTLFIQGCKNP